MVVDGKKRVVIEVWLLVGTFCWMVHFRLDLDQEDSASIYLPPTGKVLHLKSAETPDMGVFHSL